MDSYCRLRSGHLVVHWNLLLLGSPSSSPSQGGSLDVIYIVVCGFFGTGVYLVFGNHQCQDYSGLGDESVLSHWYIFPWARGDFEWFCRSQCWGTVCDSGRCHGYRDKV